MSTQGSSNAQRSRKRTRKDKISDGEVRLQKDKFKEQNESKIKVLNPLNNNQKHYMSCLKRDKLVIAKGASGTGKSFLACNHAANSYIQGVVDKIVLIRPYEFVGRTIGFRKGDGKDKLRPLMESMLQPLEEVFGKKDVEYMIEKDIIVLEALEDVRGRSYKNAIVIVDEAQNCDIRTIQTLVTRIGENCQIIVCGDGISWQTDIKQQTGLLWLADTIKNSRRDQPSVLDDEDYTELCNSIGMVDFTPNDVVRSGISKMFVKLFDHLDTK